MQRSVHRTAHLLAAVLLLTASVASAAPLAAAAVPATGMEMAGGSCCPLMTAESCRRAEASGFSCCDDGDERPGVPLDEAAPSSVTTIPVPVGSVVAAVPPAPAAVPTGSGPPAPLPPRPDLFLLHASFLT